MKIATDLRLFYVRKLLSSLRNPIFVFMGITIPLLYLLLFSPLLSNVAGTRCDVLTLFVPGMLALIAFSGGMFAGFGMIDEVRCGVIERFRVTPASRFAILAGPVLRDVSTVVAQGALFVVISSIFGFRPSLLGLPFLFFLLMLLTLITSSLGNALGLILKSEDRLAPLVHGINLPVMLLSGVLLPMSLAPRWLQVLAHCNPVYYVVEAARLLVVGEVSHLLVLRAFAILLPLALLSLRWATRVVYKVVL